MPAHAIECNGVAIVRTSTGIAVQAVGLRDQETPLSVQVEYGGKRLKDEVFQPRNFRWRDYHSGIDMLRVVVRVVQGGRTLAELSLPDEEYPLPFMVAQGEQRHVTENYVSVPPALHITDSLGAVWTLGFKVATKDESPDGEFAFEVLRDGVGTGAIASRVERSGGKIRCFTRHGWKRWLGREWS